MNIEFLYSIAILGIIFFILSSGFKFFLNLKQELDFSYLAIVVFGAYSSVYISNNFDYGIILSLFLAFLISIFFTFFILFLSSKLSEVYFVIGTLSLYILSIHLAYNIDSLLNLEITGGAMGSIVLNKEVFGIYLGTNQQFFIFTALFSGFIILFLSFFKRTIFYKTLIGWGENETVVKSLGVKVNIYKLFLIFLTTFLATVSGSIFSFYFMYIEPKTFWIPLMSGVLIISLLSYRFKEIGTLIIAFFVIFSYEYLRFAKLVDPTQLGYFRELLYGILIMVSSYIIFKKTDFGREV